jgi:hypothetical protein
MKTKEHSSLPPCAASLLATQLETLQLAGTERFGGHKRQQVLHYFGDGKMNKLFKMTAMAALVAGSLALTPPANAQSVIVGAGGCNPCATGLLGGGLAGSPLLGNAFYGPSEFGWGLGWFRFGHRIYRRSEGAWPFRTIASSAVIEEDWPVAGYAPGMMSLFRPRVGFQLSNSPVF